MKTKQEIVKIKLADLVGEEEWNRPMEDMRVEMDVLVASMAQVGQLTPIVVRPAAKSKWKVVMGNRRVLAARKLKWTELSAVVQEMDEEEARTAAFAENYARKKIGIYWEAEEIRRMLAKGMTVGAVAAWFGRSEGWVRRRMKLDLDACRRLQVEILDPLGMKIEEVHATNLEMLGDLTEECWKELQQRRDEDPEGLRKDLLVQGYVSNEILCDFHHVEGKAWSGAVEDGEVRLPPCEACEHNTTTMRGLFPELWWSLGNEGLCTRTACVELKQKKAQEKARADAKKKYPKLEVKTREDFPAMDWWNLLECKASHKDAFIALETGATSGEWRVVREMKNLPEKEKPASAGTEAGQGAGTEAGQGAKAIIDPSSCAEKRMWNAMEKLVAGVKEGPNVSDVARDIFAMFVELAWSYLDYNKDSPADEEILATVVHLAEEVLEGEEKEAFLAAVEEYRKVTAK